MASDAAVPKLKLLSKNLDVGPLSSVHFIDDDRLVFIGRQVGVADGRVLKVLDTFEAPDVAGDKPFAGASAIGRDGRWGVVSFGQEGGGAWDLVEGRRAWWRPELPAVRRPYLAADRFVLLTRALGELATAGEELRLRLADGEVLQQRQTATEVLGIFADGERMLTNHRDDGLLVRRVDDDEVVLKTAWPERHKQAWPAQLAADDSFAICCYGKTVVPVDLATGETRRPFRKGHRHGPSGIAFTAGHTHAICNDVSGVRVFDLGSLEMVASVNVRDNIGGLALSPDGARVACATLQGLRLFALPDLSATKPYGAVTSR